MLEKVNSLDYLGLIFKLFPPDLRKCTEQRKPVRNFLLCLFQEGRRREGEKEREREEIKTTWEREVKEDRGPEGQLGPWRKIESLNVFLPETKAQAHLKNKGRQLSSKACCAPNIGT